MPTAFSILPNRFEDDRHGTLTRGLARAGYRIVFGGGQPQDERDVLITWTVHRGHKEAAARAFEAAGGRVIVAEEAYIRIVRDEKCFALALHDHNGAGRWPIGGPERWAGFGIEVKAWRESGRYIIVREQRSIGSSAMASPPRWHEAAMAKLRGLTKRPILLRYHPKSRAHRELAMQQPFLALQLADAHALVTWNSADAVAALLAGVPVFLCGPHSVVEGACDHDLSAIENPGLPYRLPVFERLAWAQWRRSEIESGVAFEHLLGGRGG